MPKANTDWEIYERLVARLMADQASTDMCVTPNARVRGVISGRRRQIDVLLEPRHDTDNTRRIIVDAKKRKRKIDVKDVEEFRGLMDDVAATHGYLVCPKGHTKAAEHRAQEAVSIRLLPLERLAGFDPSTWPPCKAAGCSRGRVFWDGYPEMFMDLGSAIVGVLERVSFVHYVGKCDRCGRFHVYCRTCEDILSVPENDGNDHGHQCRCRPPWFWVASLEEDDSGAQSAELHAVIVPKKEVITANRRSL